MRYTIVSACSNELSSGGPSARRRRAGRSRAPSTSADAGKDAVAQRSGDGRRVMFRRLDDRVQRRAIAAGARPQTPTRAAATRTRRHVRSSSSARSTSNSRNRRAYSRPASTRRRWVPLKSSVHEADRRIAWVTATRQRGSRRSPHGATSRTTGCPPARMVAIRIVSSRSIAAGRSNARTSTSGAAAASNNAWTLVAGPSQSQERRQRARRRADVGVAGAAADPAARQARLRESIPPPTAHARGRTRKRDARSDPAAWVLIRQEDEQQARRSCGDHCRTFAGGKPARPGPRRRR